ncbi:MAG: hypothetical protein FJ265_08845 [Planctomycetes bacterium]|nr:hypothetical protein [Planctomycetota bacterium]
MVQCSLRPGPVRSTASGSEPLALANAAGEAWNMSRFLANLVQPELLVLIRQVFDKQVAEPGAAVPDLGAHAAADSTDT